MPYTKSGGCPGVDGGRSPARKLAFRVEGELDLLAGLPLERGDQLPDRLVLGGVEPFRPPDDEVGGAGAERHQDERGSEEDGPDPHGAAPWSALTPQHGPAREARQWPAARGSA